MRKLGEGDTSVAIENAGARNELGAMASAVVFFRDAMIERSALADAQKASVVDAETPQPQP